MVRKTFFHHFRLARQEMFTESAGDRPNVPNYMVIMTDGGSNNMNATQVEAMLARADGITIFSVAIGPKTYPKEVAGMASAPVANNSITLKDFQGLNDDVKSWLTRSICFSEWPPY